MAPFQGTITALITPFRDNRLDEAALEKLVEHQVQSGVDGLVACGTTGESPTLSKEEHRRVVELIIRTVRKRIPVLAGAGSFNTAEAVRLAHEAHELGADGLLVVSPYYNKPTQEGLRLHFSSIAREVSLPIMLYNIPGRCGVEISIDTILRLRAEHANIVAVKHATGSVVGAAELIAACPEIDVLSGDDPITWPLMALGATGVVSVLSNLAPRAVKSLTAAALAGDAAAALRAHRDTFPLAQSLLSLETNPIPIKTAMALRGWCTEEFRLPMCPLRPENRARLEDLLRRFPLQ